ncbi:MAG: dihydrofolate reductase family protein [Anaerolineales bacterium]|jgi:dihydrofolate reductase
MRKIIVSEFVTLDGIMDDPGGAEKSERGGWAFQFERGPEGDKFKLDEVMEAEALLLGRVTYEGFAAAWPSRTGEFAEKMNNMPKYVVSSTLVEPKWNNSRLIKSNVIEEVSKLKASPGGDILVAGSGRLVNTLLQQALVDVFRLIVYPVILGKGKRLFNEGIANLPLRLEQAKPVGSGVVILVYHYERKQ